jgi:hypothetical protein
LSIVEEKRMEEFTVEMHLSSILLCKNFGQYFGIYRYNLRLGDKVCVE